MSSMERGASFLNTMVYTDRITVPVSPDQINNVLGTESITEIAGKVGVSRNQISEGLASILPQIIDKLTPDGKVPEGGMLENSLSALAGKFLKG